MRPNRAGGLASATTGTRLRSSGSGLTEQDGLWMSALEKSRFGFVLWIYGPVLIVMMAAHIVPQGPFEKVLFNIGYAGFIVCGIWLLFFIATAIAMAIGRIAKRRSASQSSL